MIDTEVSIMPPMPLTGNEIIANVMAEINAGITPAAIYPPGYFDWLEAVGTNYMPAMHNGPTRPVRSRPMGQLITLGISVGGGRGFSPMMMRPSPSDPAPDLDYTVIDLGTLGGTVSGAQGINNAGQVVGYAYLDSSSYRGFLSANGPMQNLGVIVNGDSGAYGINASGQIAGFSGIMNYQHAMKYSGSSWSDLGTLGGSHSIGWAINASGTVVGYSLNDAGNYHGFLYSSGPMSDIGNFGDANAYNEFAFGIDDFGDITGSCTTNGNTHAFLLADGTMTDIGTLGGNDSTAYGINMYAEVVGVASVSRDSWHAFFYDYQNGTMQDLGVLSGSSSTAYAVNANAHVVGTSGGHAFLVSNGSMKDLNNVVINNGSGWTFQYAYSINDNEQIVGIGLNPSGQSHAFLLTPLPVGWQANITADTSRHSFGDLDTASGKDSLILITHGRIPSGDDPVASSAWIDSMSNSIVNYLTAHGINNWKVRGYKWTDDANASVFNVLENAKQHGVSVGLQIIAQGYTNVHLISHSAGAGLIQAATDVIKAHNSSVVVHETFLDPYVGYLASGANAYGVSADWAENYFTRDQETEILGTTFPFTDFIMPHTYNVDVTQLDVTDRVQRDYFVTGSGTPCYKTKSKHGWPIDFYSNTITGTVTSDYHGFGFPLSEVGGQWSYALSHYVVGNGRTYGIVTNLGSADPACFLDIPAPSYPSSVTDFINNTGVQSTTGTIDKFANGSIQHKTGSPAWLATFLTISNDVNLVTFDAEFQSTNTTSQGLLSVYWDGNTIGSIDERVVQGGFQHYTFKFPTAPSNSMHMLGFRLDTFTNMQSVITLTNVTTTADGVTQPFTLSIVGSTNGSLMYQLGGQAGFEYTVQASTNLFDWTVIASLLNTNGTVQFYDKNATNYSQRFYRAVAPF